MRGFERGPYGPDGSDPIDLMIDDAFRRMREENDEPGTEFKARLLSGFDDVQRRRNRLSLSTFADAFGWRALARPLGAAGFLASVCVSGFLAGAVAAPADSGAYDELAAAFDQSFALTEEGDQWVEE